MHNETKVNTKISAVATLEAKNNIFAAKHVGVITTPYGVQLVNSGDGLAHAEMRGRQLSGLLRLMQGTARKDFQVFDLETQASLMWLAVQLAEEMEDMVRVVAADARGGSA